MDSLGDLQVVKAEGPIERSNNIVHISNQLLVEKVRMQSSSYGMKFFLLT